MHWKLPGAQPDWTRMEVMPPLERTGIEPARAPQFAPGAEHALEIVRMEGEHPRARVQPVEHLLDVPGGRRSDVAEVLREKEIRPELPHPLRVDPIEAFPRARGLPNETVDFGAGKPLRIHDAPRHDRLAPGGRRIGAFVRDAHETPTGPEGIDHFRRRGLKRNDPHAAIVIERVRGVKPPYCPRNEGGRFST